MTQTLAVQHPYDLQMTVAYNRTDKAPARQGSGGWFWRVQRTPEGPVTVAMRQPEPHRVEVRGWGPGRDWAMAHLDRWLGLNDDPSGFEAHHPMIRDQWRRHPGLRIGATLEPLEVLLWTIAGQRVTTASAQRSWREMKHIWGAAPPEPTGGMRVPPELRLPPCPDTLSQLSYAHLHRVGLERSRAKTVLEVCRRRKRITALGELEPEDARQRLMSLPGIGPWTANRVAIVAWGHPDTVQTGDYWLPHMIVHALTGRPRSSDEEMLSVLDVYRPQRTRAVRLIATTNHTAPRYGAKLPAISNRGR